MSDNKNIGFNFNGPEAMDQFEKLTLKEMKKAAKAALRAGSGTIIKQTKKNIKSSLPAAMNRSSKYNDRLIDGAKYGVNKTGKFATFHVLGVRKSGSGTYRLRFFENGTKERVTKKGQKRGSLQGYHFFSSAVDSTKNNIEPVMKKKLNETIEKINKAKIDGK